MPPKPRYTKTEDGWVLKTKKPESRKTQAYRARVHRAYHMKKEYALRDIADIPPGSNFKHVDFSAINWKRRLACKEDPLLDLKTYFPNVFYLPWAKFQVDLIREIEDRIQTGGKKAFGLPRASGKTAITRAMIVRATKYGMRQFAFFIGSREDKAKQTLDFIKNFWYRNELLRQDFPEIAYPIYRIEGRSKSNSQGQLYKDQRTHLRWAANELQYPSMLLDEEDVQGYLKHDPDSVIWLPDVGVNIERFIINSAGCLIRVAGIDGSIRGEADVHPILLTQPRPDLVLLDDVQKDQRAESPKSCEDLERLIESSIAYLSAPDVSQACLMPCTVIREGDVSDTYLSPSKKPEWSGERHGLIKKYPVGMSDEAILDEVDGKPNEVGMLWLEYKEIREESLLKYGNLKLANEFYKKHREIMDEGFEVTWPDRYKKDSKDENKNEISAIQSAMNWYFQDHGSFLSEGQNRPASRLGDTALLLTPEQVAEHMTEIPRGEVSLQWTNIVAFIDVQDEILFYTVLAHDMDFNGQVIDYGTYPKVNSSYFRKNMTYGWKMLSRMFYRDHPNVQHDTKSKAPFEAKIYHALKQCCGWLLSQQYPTHDEGNVLGIRAIGIDMQWGKASEVVKRFLREARNQRLIGYQGHPYLPSYRQLEEYELRPGWLFEHQLHPHLKESKWVVKPLPGGGRYVLADVNRLKTFLMHRLAAPIGSEGTITLFQANPHQHLMFSEHVAGSEYPEPVTARGMTKECWQIRPNSRGENDYLDCLAGCICLASICGASLKTEEYKQRKPVKRKSLSEVYKQKRSA